VALGATEIEGLFRPTRKNGLVNGFYTERGFTAADPADPAGDVHRFVAAAAGVPASPAWIAVTAPQQRTPCRTASVP
jgi:predicted enzyme involved in methoxymalonyl-ACP biosynthesis